MTTNDIAPAGAEGNISRIEYRGQPVMTTEQLAAAYGASAKNIQDNHQSHTTRFVEGVDFWRLTADELRAFKNYPANSGVVDKRAPHLTLWTERGALNHAKLLESDTAWRVFGSLVDTYFMSKAAPPTLAPAMPDFTDPVAAARAWADQFEARRLAERTKAEIGTRREATAMNTASQAVKRANRLEVELDRARSYATVKRMSLLHHGQDFNWRLLKRMSEQKGILPIDVFDANYGTVKAYHAEVWQAAYALDIPERDEDAAEAVVLRVVEGGK